MLQELTPEQPPKQPQELKHDFVEKHLEVVQLSKYTASLKEQHPLLPDIWARVRYFSFPLIRFCLYHECIIPQVDEADFEGIVCDKGTPISIAHKKYFLAHAKSVQELHTHTHPPRDV